MPTPTSTISPPIPIPTISPASVPGGNPLFGGAGAGAEGGGGGGLVAGVVEFVEGTALAGGGGEVAEPFVAAGAGAGGGDDMEGGRRARCVRCCTGFPNFAVGQGSGNGNSLQIFLGNTLDCCVW